MGRFATRHRPDYLLSLKKEGPAHKGPGQLATRMEGVIDLATRRSVSFGIGVGSNNISRGGKKSDVVRGDLSTSSVLTAGGWELRLGSGYALGYTEARCFARRLTERVGREMQLNEVRKSDKYSEWLSRSSLLAFCVRGELPIESEQVGNRCGCTAIVLCGVQMKVPEKVFARSFVEVRRGSSTESEL